MEADGERGRRRSLARETRERHESRKRPRVACDGGESGWPLAAGCARSAADFSMSFHSLTPRVRAALRQLASGPQDMRDEALLKQINDEMKKLPVDEIAYVRDRVRFSCPPCPMVQSVILMLEGLIEVKNLNL